MEALKKATHFLNVVLVWIASFFLGAMIFLTCGNIFLRAVWLPLRGTFELMGYFGAIVTAFALGYAQIGRSHIAVDILVLRFSKKTRKILNGVNYLICTVFFSIVAWQIAKHATTLWKTGEVTETLRFAYYPFTYGVSLGCLVLALVMFVDFLQLLIGDKGEK
ncbi:MAG: TRAP transporter small permease [Deltaproteobacteria bacterium]|nr:TRAP transporter small permease [Deltaproteobacteria bacterium]MBW2302755.1 TRAP transporter small permease [Deltaproteobacteria bacterium]